MTTFRDNVCKIAGELAAARIFPPDPRVDEMTEGRIKYAKYAWCGDFATYVLMKAGASRTDCLNRAELNGTWRIGRNIDMLIQCAKAGGFAYGGAKSYARLQENQHGDVVIMQNTTGGHVCFLADVVNGEVYKTWDGNSKYGGTAAVLRSVSEAPIAWVLDVDGFCARAIDEIGSTGSSPVPPPDAVPTDLFGTLLSLPGSMPSVPMSFARDTNPSEYAGFLRGATTDSLLGDIPDDDWFNESGQPADERYRL